MKRSFFSLLTSFSWFLFGITLELCVMALCDDLGRKEWLILPQEGLYTHGT